ncbi:MAG: DUF350 domain-containing protein [Solirubrobacterales bacterium]
MNTAIFNGMGSTLIWWALAMVLLLGGYVIYDKIWTKIDFNAELLKGNVAVGVVIAGFFVALGIIIAAAIS